MNKQRHRKRKDKILLCKQMSCMLNWCRSRSDSAGFGLYLIKFEPDGEELILVQGWSRVHFGIKLAVSIKVHRDLHQPRFLFGFSYISIELVLFSRAIELNEELYLSSTRLSFGLLDLYFYFVTFLLWAGKAQGFLFFVVYGVGG